MNRFLPKSLMGQTLLAAAVALLIAQVISASLLYRAAEQRRLDNIAERIASRYSIGGTRYAMVSIEARKSLDTVTSPTDLGLSLLDRRLPRKTHFRYTDNLETMEKDIELSAIEPVLRQRIAAEFTRQSFEGKLRVVQRPELDDPMFEESFRSANLTRSEMRDDGRQILVAAIKPQGANRWSEVRVRLPKQRSRPLPGIILQTGVLFIVLLGFLYLILRRITRPLAALTSRVEAFSGNPEQSSNLEESGPQDMRRLIAAHNAMEARVAALIDEKDVMLGAIGHDLKTPLAALRVRIESVPDDTQRARMADSIEDITHTLDDILSLARIGHSGVEADLTDLAALTASVAEEFEDLGDPVTLEKVERVTLPVQVTWLKRALRNLVSNAVRYGQTARVSLLSDDGAIILRVDDDGPGIPQEQIADMLEPFQRGETSRNRGTGGAGLGLTLARAIAQQHGGTLSLTNRPKESGEVGGLRAEIRLPANQAD